MLIENSWWESEASGTFSDMSVKYGQQWSKQNRRFGMMPVPKADDGGKSSDMTLLCTGGDSVVCIYSGSTRTAMAEDFLRYLHSDEGLRIFNRYTGVSRPFYYDLLPSDLAQMTEFTRNMYGYVHDQQLPIVFYNMFETPLRRDNYSYFVDWSWNSTINATPYTDPFLAFRPGKIKPQDYFNGLLAPYADWSTRFK